MGPTSDLGPVDPQFLLPNGSLAAARAIIAAVEEAERRIQQNPTTYPLHASLLSDITAIMVQQARDAMERTGDLVEEALACVGSRSQDDVGALAGELKKHLIGEPTDHRAIISAHDAKRYGRTGSSESDRVMVHHTGRGLVPQVRLVVPDPAPSARGGSEDAGGL